MLLIKSSPKDSVIRVNAAAAAPSFKLLILQNEGSWITYTVLSRFLFDFNQIHCILQLIRHKDRPQISLLQIFLTRFFPLRKNSWAQICPHSLISRVVYHYVKLNSFTLYPATKLENISHRWAQWRLRKQELLSKSTFLNSFVLISRSTFNKLKMLAFFSKLLLLFQTLLLIYLLLTSTSLL